MLLKVVFKQKLYAMLKNISTAPDQEVFAVTDQCTAHERKGIKHTCVGRLGRDQFHNSSKFIRSHCCITATSGFFCKPRTGRVPWEWQKGKQAKLTCLVYRAGCVSLVSFLHINKIFTPKSTGLSHVHNGHNLPVPALPCLSSVLCLLVLYTSRFKLY